MKSCSRRLTAILFLSLLNVELCSGFRHPNQSYNNLQRHGQRRRRTPRNFYSASNDYDYDSQLIDAASILLEWERIEERNVRPTLNLSARDESPEEVEDGSSAATKATTGEDWDQGQRWEVTLQGLIDIGLFVSDDKGDQLTEFLTNCPQLLRLDPTMVLETANWIVKEFNIGYLESEPSLLSYRCNDVKYGLEFMSMMMMMPSLEATKTACMSSPKLLLAGITGGIQEQYVKTALGKASDATRDANQRIAGDMMSSLNQLKNSKKKGLL